MFEFVKCVVFAFVSFTGLLWIVVPSSGCILKVSLEFSNVTSSENY